MNDYDIENIFNYHTPNDETAKIHSEIREKYKELARFVFDECPNSREKALALTNLENSMFWANASIARNK